MAGSFSDPEAARLEAIARYAILDTPPDGAFDRVTKLAAQLFDAPVAICSIIDHERIWFKSVHGLEGVTELPREPGLCSSAIAENRPYVVEDAAADPRSCRNSLVTGPFGLRFYVGVPLHTNDGHNLGTLCVVDREPREADGAKVAMLASLAQIVIDELELRLAARRVALESAPARAASELPELDLDVAPLADPASHRDALTGLGNRRAFDLELDRARPGKLTFAAISVGGTNVVADRRGPWWSEQMLRAFGDALRGSFRPGDRIFRISSEEFIAVIGETDRDAGFIRLRVESALRTVRLLGFPEIRCSCGIADTAEAESLRGAFRLADARMYAEKIAER